MAPAETSEASEYTQRIVLEGPILWVIVAMALLMAAGPWIYIAWATQRSYDPATGRTSSTLLLPTGTSEPDEDVGPWGRLQTFDIVIAPPLEFVQSVSDARSSVDWRLQNTSREQFAEMLAQLGLDQPTRLELLELARPDEAGSGLVISPSHDFLWKLAPEARAKLYHALALDTANQVQSQAFRFAGSIEDWFAGSGVSEETLDLVKKLAYPYSKSVFLADLHVLLPRLSKQEQVRVLKAVSGQRTLSMQLKVNEDDNLAELAEYWGRGRRSKDVRPLLESLAKVKGGGTIDVAHLLPSFARMRIYTYPRPATQDEGYLQNCHWTAFNFFSATPDDRFTRLEDALAELKANYYPIYRNPALGDLVVFSDQADPMFHVAVYVADDVLFTKNGNTFSLPWMYMRMEQMKDFYARPLPVQVSYFRHKTL